MTEDEYIDLCRQDAEEKARDVLKNHLKPFELVANCFIAREMSEEEFAEFLEDVTNDKKE